MELANGIGMCGVAQCQHRHIKGRTPFLQILAQRHKRLSVEPQPVPIVPEVLFHQVKGEGIMTGWDRGVGGKNGRGAHGGSRVFKAQPVVDQLADALQHQKGRVPFVHMPHGWLNTQRSQRPHAADAQNDLLFDAHLLVATVQPMSQFAIPRCVLLYVGVHQIQVHAPDLDMPQLRVDDLSVQLHLHEQALAILVINGADGHLVRVERFIDRVLPAMRGDALAKVALGIQKANANKGQTQIAGFFAMIARKDTQAAGINGQRLMQTKLEGKVRNRSIDMLRILRRKPKSLALGVTIEIHQNGIVGSAKQRIARRYGDLLRRHCREHLHRPMCGTSPRRPIQHLEQAPGIIVPAPPQVIGQFVQPVHLCW